MGELLNKKFNPLYSLGHLTLIECSPPELIYIAARAGYDAVSPRLIKMNVPGEFKPSPISMFKHLADCSKNNWIKGFGY